MPLLDPQMGFSAAVACSRRQRPLHDFRSARAPRSASPLWCNLVEGPSETVIFMSTDCTELVPTTWPTKTLEHPPLANKYNNTTTLTLSMVKIQARSGYQPPVPNTPHHTDPLTNISYGVDIAAVNALTTLLAVDFSAVVSILDHQGIIQVPIRNEDANFPESEQDELVTELGTPTSRVSRNREDSEEETAGSAEGRRASSGPGGFFPISSPQTSQTSRTAHVSPPPAYSPPTEDEQYRLLLNGVITAAREASFPYLGNFDMSALAIALPRADDTDGYNGFDGSDVAIRFRSDTQLKRDMKIGAAGELYVFELLSRLDPALVNWSRENWKSTVRKYVTVHREYANMGEWCGRETADMTYDDTSGTLTALLVENEYLSEDEWAGAKPFYYLEVKTTTGPCETPFFMSKSQYKRMRDIHAAPDQKEVYVILRVYGLGGGRIGMAVHLDPEQLKLEGELNFRAETWSVVPS